MGPASPKPTTRVRQGGGFNQGLGSFADEHLEENAMQQAMQQKMLQQQSAQTGTKSQSQQGGVGQPPPPPREVGSIPEEALRFGRDVWTGVRQFFSLNTWLNINPNTKNPEELAKQKQIHQRWQRLTEDQQAVAKQNYQRETQRKKAQAEEEEQKKQQAQAREQAELPMPSSPQKGPIGPAGSKKQKAIQKLQQDRQQMSGPSGSN